MADRFENIINLDRLREFYDKISSKFFAKLITTDAVTYDRTNNSKKTTTFASAFANKVEKSLVGTDETKALSATMGTKLNNEKLSSADFKIVKWSASNKVNYKGNALTAVYVPIEISGWEPIGIAGYSTACPNAFPLDIHFEVDNQSWYRRRIAINVKLQQSSNYSASNVGISILYVKKSVTPTSGNFSTTMEPRSVSVTV